MSDGEFQLWHEVGTTGGTFIAGEDECEVVGIIYQMENGEEETRYLTIPAAKSLIIDLGDAIEACVQHKSNPKD